MKGRYYVFNGFYTSSKWAKERLDRLVPKNYKGNVMERLVARDGYRVDEEKGILYSPDGKIICFLAN